MLKILIIEDNKEIRENTAEILELYNYKVETAENGLLGLERAMKIIPDLILCDIMMPDLNGYEVLEKLKGNTPTIFIPFIFFTAKSESFDLQKGLKMGADAYLIKPFDDDELINTIQEVIKKRVNQ